MSKSSVSIKGTIITGGGSHPLLNWSLLFPNLLEKVMVLCDAGNTGTLNSFTSINVGSITVSTDDISYSPLTLPFTPVVGTTYYFKRSTFSTSGSYSMEGVKLNEILTWNVLFEDGHNTISVDCTTDNEGIITSGVGFNTNDVLISTDGDNFNNITYPLTFNSGTTYYLKRSLTSGVGTLNLTGYYV